MEFIHYEEKLKQYITNYNIAAEHIHFPASVHTVAEAAKEAGAEADDFVKSVCMISNDITIIAIILGSDKVKQEKIEKLLKIKKPHIASPEEALQFTGYPVGGTPPFGYPAIYLMNQTVLSKNMVYAGGGSPQALIRISPQEILRINNAKIARVRKR